MTVGSLFSGIGGFDLGLERAGHEIVWQVDHDEQAQSVLRRHWPDVDLYKDVCDVGSDELAPVELICGGFPCQDLSVAGKREGLAGERSGLWHEFRRIVGEIAPRWVLIENVPGLLSSNGGADMAVVLGGLEELGYGWTYRVLDSQYFGVAQRRRRVFIVGCSGGRPRPEILFEPESLPWHSAPSREAGAGVAGTLEARAATGGYDPGAHGAASGHIPLLEVGARTNGDGYRDGDGIGRDGDPMYSLQASKQHGVAYQCHGSNVGPMGSLRAGNGNEAGGVPFLAFANTAGDTALGMSKPGAPPITTRHGDPGNVVRPGTIPRRLTPRECERLQGFPDDWTRWDSEGNELADSPRYRMLGNAVTVNVAHWIGQRLKDAATRGIL